MAAPKGNEFWKLRSKHGKEKIFNTPEIMWKAACDYFQWVENNPLKEEKIVTLKDTYQVVELKKMRPFTLAGLCIYLGVNTVYFNNFEYELTDEKPFAKEYREVLTRIREVIYNQKFEGAATGFFNHNIIARDLGLIDKSETKGEVTLVSDSLKVEYSDD